MTAGIGYWVAAPYPHVRTIEIGIAIEIEFFILYSFICDFDADFDTEKTNLL